MNNDTDLTDLEHLTPEQAADLSINISHWPVLYLNGNHNQLTQEFLHGLSYFYQNSFTNLSSRERLSITRFLECFLFYFVRADYQITTEAISRFIALGCVTSNLIKLSHFKNADPWIKILLSQENSFEKILCLYSPRSEIVLDSKSWFNKAPILSSLWWAHYFNHASSFASKQVYDNCLDHLSNLSEKYAFFGIGSGEPYLTVSYLNPLKDSIFKKKFNQLATASLAHIKVRTGKESRRVAIVSKNWVVGHSVYKSFQPMVEHLAENFDLTLIQLGDGNSADDSLFKKVIKVASNGGSLELGPILEGKFDVAFYTDIGEGLESKYLSNLRIAPIQIVGYGHPISTFGSTVDYFLAGAAVENQNPEQYYSERVVLIQGLGIHPVIQNRQAVQPMNLLESHKIQINCPWDHLNFNFPMMEILIQIQENSDFKIQFQFLINEAELHKANHFEVFKMDLHELLGAENCEIRMGQHGEEYQNAICRGTIGLDSYPFCNLHGVLDNLCLGIPVVTYRGERAHSRISAALLEMLDLPELVADSRDEYKKIALGLLNDMDFLSGIKQKLNPLYIEKKLLEIQSPDALTRAISHLISNHEKLKSEIHGLPVIVA